MGAVGDFDQGEVEGFVVEVVGGCSASGEVDCLVPAGLEGLVAVPVGASDDADLPELSISVWRVCRRDAGIMSGYDYSPKYKGYTP